MYQQELYQTRKTEGPEDGRWQDQIIWKDPSDVKFNSETEKHELHGFVYWANDNLSSIIIFQKKQLELPQHWQIWHDCAESHHSILEPTTFEH